MTIFERFCTSSLQGTRSVWDFRRGRPTGGELVINQCFDLDLGSMAAVCILDPTSYREPDCVAVGLIRRGQCNKHIFGGHNSSTSCLISFSWLLCFSSMGTRVMNEYSYPEGKYSSENRQRELLGERENVSGYEVPKKESNQNGENILF